MFTRFLTLAVLITTLHSHKLVAADSIPELMQMPVQKVFIPNGFDDNDKTQVVVESYLPNPCYKVGPHEIRIDKINKVIRLDQWVYRYPGMMCPQMIVPFAMVYDIGVLVENSYDIRDGASEESLGTLAVRRSTNLGPDDYFYAPVSDARVDLTKGQVIIEGTFTNECLAIDQVKVFADPKNVVIVQPILKPWKNDRTCKEGKFPFKIATSLPKLSAGHYLLHVRSMNGVSINKTFDVLGGM